VKFGYAIVLALVALVAVSGFAAADRLPSQVPENQIFTIDTLIDVTGAVSEESEMQWTLDDMEWVAETATWDRLVGTEFSAFFVANPWVATAINNANPNDVSATWATWPLVLAGNDGLDRLVVSDWMLDELIDPANSATLTWRGLLALIDANVRYSMDEVTARGQIDNGVLNPTEEIMILTWTDSLRSNGGKLSLNKNIDFDSTNKGNGLSNLEVEKVLTYASTEGAHLVGAEEWTLDVAGNWDMTENTIRCVFASATNPIFPAFCNVVKAKSELVNINSAQISTKGSARGVASSGDIPAMLNYQIAVTPDSNSGSGFADGTVKTFFGGSIMEARGRNNVPSATNNWKDAASVTGGIKNFQKTFGIWRPGLEHRPRMPRKFSVAMRT